MNIITKATTGYPDEYRDALRHAEFDVRVTTARDRDAYSTQTRGTMSQTDTAFVFAALLEGAPLDSALDTLELAQNILIGRQWMREEAMHAQQH